MKTAAGLACVMMLMALAGPALAQTPDYAEINRRVPPPASAEVLAALTATQADCPATNAKLSAPQPVTAWVRVSAAVAQGEIANAWTVIATREGCAGPAEGRYLLIRGVGGGLVAQFLHPGRSYADVHEMTDGVMTKAFRTAANTAARDVPGCRPEMISRSGGFLGAEVVDQSKIGPSPWGLYASGAWRESWSFAICGRVLTVFVDFTATEDGVTGQASPWASLKR
jgi:hypothetical protein